MRRHRVLMAAERLERGPEDRETLLAARAAGNLPRQDRREQERGLGAGLDLAPDMVPDRAVEEPGEGAPLEVLVEEQLLAAHCPPMFGRLGA